MKSNYASMETLKATEMIREVDELQEQQPKHLCVRRLTLVKDSGKYGLRVRSLHAGIFVCLVVDGSPAAKAGLRFGDQILQIDGQDMSHLTVSEVHSILKKNTSGQKVTLAIRDSPFERQVTLVRDASGKVGIEFRSGRIVHTLGHSSAARNGLLSDHNLVEINGKNVIGLSDKQITNVITGSGKYALNVAVMPATLYQQMVQEMNPALFRQMNHQEPVLVPVPDPVEIAPKFEEGKLLQRQAVEKPKIGACADADSEAAMSSWQWQSSKNKLQTPQTPENEAQHESQMEFLAQEQKMLNEKKPVVVLQEYPGVTMTEEEVSLARQAGISKIEFVLARSIIDKKTATMMTLHHTEEEFALIRQIGIEDSGAKDISGKLILSGIFGWLYYPRVSADNVRRVIGTDAETGQKIFAPIQPGKFKLAGLCSNCSCVGHILEECHLLNYSFENAAAELKLDELPEEPKSPITIIEDKLKLFLSLENDIVLNSTRKKDRVILATKFLYDLNMSEAQRRGAVEKFKDIAGSDEQAETPFSECEFWGGVRKVLEQLDLQEAGKEKTESEDSVQKYLKYVQLEAIAVKEREIQKEMHVNSCNLVDMKNAVKKFEEGTEAVKALIATTSRMYINEKTIFAQAPEPEKKPEPAEPEEAKEEEVLEAVDLADAEDAPFGNDHRISVQVESIAFPPVPVDEIDVEMEADQLDNEDSISLDLNTMDLVRAHEWKSAEEFHEAHHSWKYEECLAD